MKKKNKIWLSECCNEHMYPDGTFRGYSCSQCDGNGLISEPDEGCGEEECDGSCSICSPEDYETPEEPRETSKYYDIESLSNFTKEIITIARMVSLHMNSIAPDKQWYPEYFDWVKVIKETITLKTYFTDGTDQMIPLIHLYWLGDCTFITVDYNQKGSKPEEIRGALSDNVLKEMLSHLANCKPKSIL